VQLHVLPVGDVRGVAGELGGHAGDDPQLLGREPAAVDPDAEHEVLVVQLVRLEHGRLAAVDPGAALGVEAPPPQPVGGVDRREPGPGVDVLDAGPDVQPVVVLLEPLVGRERLEVAQGPLALALVSRATRGGWLYSHVREALRLGRHEAVRR
jgi:hypothetical protein